MKSKISFFNKTIFWKNVTLYWPIWTVYFLFLFFPMPFSLWLSVLNRYDVTPLTEEKMIREIYYILEPQYYIFVIAFASVIGGMALFSYLYKSQSANMIHSLPVDRTELFGTNLISGMAFLIVPQIVTFVITVLLCLSEGITKVEYLGMWLILAMVTAFIAFSFVTICAFFTGQLVALPIYVVIINFLAYAISGMVDIVVQLFGYGINDAGLLSSEILVWFSPLVNYMRSVDLDYVYNAADKIVGISLSGIPCIIIYFIVAVGLYALAYVIYRKRKIEQAGDLITVKVLRPIFRWGVGTLCGFYVSMFFTAIFSDIGYEYSYFRLFAGVLFFGILFYFIADMVVRKTFHVFKKQNWKGCGRFVITLVATFFVLILYANVEEKRMPDKKDVIYATVNMGYYAEYEGEDVEKIMKVHELILDNLDYYEEMDKQQIYDRDYYDKSESIQIIYYLKNNRTIYRSYSVPYEGDGIEIIDTIRRLEEEPHNFLNYALGKNYDDIDSLSFSSGHLNLQRLVVYKPEYAGNNKVVDVMKELTSSQSKKIYEAIIADGLEGRLHKYNSYYGGDYEKVQGATHRIHIEVVKLTSNKNSRGIVSQEYKDYHYINLYFGKDCENIIDAIVSLGIDGIDSPEDIYWGK